MFKAVFSDGTIVEYGKGWSYKNVCKKFKYTANLWECQGILYCSDTPIAFTGNEFFLNEDYLDNNSVFMKDFISMQDERYDRKKRRKKPFLFFDNYSFMRDYQKLVKSGNK